MERNIFSLFNIAIKVQGWHSLNSDYITAWRSRIRTPVSAGHFSHFQNAQTCSANLLFSRYWDPFLRVNRPWREVKHSPPLVPRSRKGGSISLFSLYAITTRRGKTSPLLLIASQNYPLTDWLSITPDRNKQFPGSHASFDFQMKVSF